MGTTPPAPPAIPAPLAPPTSRPKFLRCWNCRYSFAGLAGLDGSAGLTCPECGLILRAAAPTPKCRCGQRLADPDRRGVAHCPACRREEPGRVPPANWPLRCQGCRSDLSGQPIHNRLVHCPTCRVPTRWQPRGGPGFTLRETIRTMLIPAIILAALGAVVAAVILAGGLTTP